MSSHAPPDPPRDFDVPRYERLLGSVDEGLWEQNLVQGTAWFSRRFRHLLGFSGTEWPSDASVLRLRVHPEDLPGFDTVLRRSAQNGAQTTLQMRLLCRDGHWRWFRTRVRVWPDERGRPTHLVGTLHDIDSEVRTLAELSSVTQRFERAIAASEEGLFDAVWGHPQVHLSDRALEMIGLPAGTPRVTYDELRAQVHPEDLPALREAVAKAIESGSRWQATYRARRFGQPDGWRWFRERGTASREGGGAIRVWGLVADISDQIHETERLELRVARRTAELAEALRLAEQQRHAAEAANRAKASFLGQMSHELRTPLNGVIGMTELALRSATAPEQRRFLDLAGQSARSMLHVVDDLLDFARAEAGRLTLAPQPFEPARVLAEAYSAFMPANRERGLRMMFDCIGPLVPLVGDASRLRQMVSNIVGNAVKFTERGRISVVATVQPLAAASGPPTQAALAIEVADTGPGMDEQTARRVFEPFEQGDATIGRRHGGAGLGLSIVRMLAELMGGQVSVRSQLGQGSTFRIDLVLPIAPGPDGHAPNLNPPRARVPGDVWLVFTPDLDSGWTARRVERLGHTTRVLHSVEATVEQARAAAGGYPALPAPQAVLIVEPAIGTGSLLPALRAALPGGCAVVLAVRPDYQQAEVFAIAHAHRFRVLVSPMTPQDLLAALEPQAPETSPAAPEPQVPPSPAEAHAEVAAPVLIVEDNAVNRLIAREMISALGLPCEETESGEAALAACRVRPPGLVLMDIQMPGMDGLQAARALRRLQEDGALPAFPIVALTAHAMPGDREASLAAGMVDHLTKPIQFDALREVLRRHLKGVAGLGG